MSSIGPIFSASLRGLLIGRVGRALWQWRKGGFRRKSSRDVSVATRLVALLAAAIPQSVLMYTVGQHVAICFSLAWVNAAIFVPSANLGLMATEITIPAKSAIDCPKNLIPTFYEHDLGVPYYV
jgi:hypothetical protein